MLFEDGGQAPSTPVASASKLIYMAQTSFNIQPCKVTASERHNKREKALSYVRSDLSHLNEWCDFLNVHLVAYDAQMRTLVKAKTGRKMQEKSRALYEGIAVIRPDTTIEDIKKLADAMHQRWGFHFVQLAIHKDEGSWQKDGTWKPNLHAHMVFDKIDHETGKTIKTTAKDTAEMQDMCARILGMERGQRGSKKEHLDALEYKVKVQEKRAALAEQAQKTAEKKLEAASERANEIAIENADAVFKLQNKNAELTRTAKEVENLRSEVESERKSRDILHDTKNRLRDEISGLNEEKSRLSSSRDTLQSEAESLANVVLSARSDLHGLQSRKQALENEILMRHQEKAQAEAAADAAKAKAKQAEVEAAKGLMVGGAKKLGNLLGLGAEAKQLKELPQQLEAARNEGKKAAVAEILAVAKLNFGGKEVTPEMVGKSWRSQFDEAKNAKTGQERQIKSANDRADYLEKMLNALTSIPLIGNCINIIVRFVRESARFFSAEDSKTLGAALAGDENNATWLRKLAYYYGGSYSQPHLSSNWDRAEEQMKAIARGEVQENQEHLGRGWRRGI